MLGFALAIGCSAGRAVRTELGMAQPEETLGAVGDLMSTRDRERLVALAAEREKASAEDGYRIGPDDLLDIRIPDLVDAGGGQGQGQGQSARGQQSGAALPSVAEAPVFQSGARVSADGEVNIPYLGLVHAAGFTPTALEQDIARRLKTAGILKAPQVNVLVTEYRSGVVAVVGSVERPGLYPLTRPRARLADLIWAAGGPGKDAGRVVSFVPAVDGAHLDGATRGEPIRLDLEIALQATGQEGNTLNPQVRPGDSISVSPAGNVQVDGWVDKPGSYPVTRGLTLTGAVAAAGGHLFPADRHHVTVKRILAPGEQRYFTVDLDAVSQGQAADFPITDGDVVRLSPTSTRLVTWGVWAAAKNIVHIYGSVPIF